MSIRALSIFLATLLFTTFSQAHNIWLERTPNTQEYVVKFGHETTETYPEHKLKAIQQLQKNGKFSPLAYHFKQGEAYFNTASKGIVTLQFDNGVWSKLPNGKWVEKTKQEAPEAEQSVHPVKMGKAILEWNAQALKSHDQVYELVPQTQPIAGKKLAILVLHKGKPVQGIKVGLGEDQPFETSDANGIAYFTPTAGHNKVWAEFEENVASNPDYSSTSVEYMLTFDVTAK